MWTVIAAAEKGNYIIGFHVCEIMNTSSDNEVHT
jgi:hypothetical protein